MPYYAGFLILVNLENFMWHDLDGDGIQDLGEPIIPNILILNCWFITYYNYFIYSILIDFISFF